MSARIIDGQAVAERIRAQITHDVETFKSQYG
ncbi:MAG: bifunctional methylenetetrahydrofolate dehydrogenase/methenyltetrahydrofolate cyclohydrolase, partial [Phototrophicales bacterium]